MSKCPANLSTESELHDQCDLLTPVALQEKILNLNAAVRSLVACFVTIVLQGEAITRIWSKTLCKNLKEKDRSISYIVELTYDIVKDVHTALHYESLVGSIYLNM